MAGDVPEDVAIMVVGCAVLVLVGEDALPMDLEQDLSFSRRDISEVSLLVAINFSLSPRNKCTLCWDKLRGDTNSFR